MRKATNLFRAIIVTTSYWCPAGALAEGPAPPMTAMTSEIAFAGKASGGLLSLVRIPRRNALYFSIVTKPGESAESVVRRLAEVINQTDPFGWHGDMFVPGFGSITANGGYLEGLPCRCLMPAGTETGLGIPLPPRSLTCTFDPRDPEDREDDVFALHWENPPEGYDSIAIVFDGFHACRPPSGGAATSYIMTGDDVPGNRLDLDVCVIGYRRDVPSNAATITLRNYAQEELVNIPFTAGVAPNWRAWSASGQADAMTFQQGEKWAVNRGFSPRTIDRIARRRVANPEDKRFFQVIETTPDGSTGGVWREFLGLIPGHRYRISARLNTLDTNAGGSWSLSLHAAHNAPDGADLTNAQMSGTAALPDASNGPTAGQIAVYGPQTTTNGKWLLRSTGQSGSDDNLTGDITLPVGVDTMTVWIRLSGSNAKAGMDWIKVEDVSPPQRR